LLQKTWINVVDVIFTYERLSSITTQNYYLKLYISTISLLFIHMVYQLKNASVRFASTHKRTPGLGLFSHTSKSPSKFTFIVEGVILPS